MKKVNIFCHSFQKVKPIYYIDSLHRVIIFKPLFIEILWSWFTDNENPDSVSQKIRILHKINKKIDILNRNVRLLKSMLISIHLVGLLYMNYCNSMWCSMEAIGLWHCSGVMEAQVALIAAFSHLHLLVLVSLNLPLDNTPLILYGVQVRRVCWPIKHSNTMVIEPAFGTFGSVG